MRNRSTTPRVAKDLRQIVETKKPGVCTPGFQHCLCLRLFRQRANQHDHLATFHFRHIFNPASFLGIFGNAQQ